MALFNQPRSAFGLSLIAFISACVGELDSYEDSGEDVASVDVRVVFVAEEPCEDCRLAFEVFEDGYPITASDVQAEAWGSAAERTTDLALPAGRFELLATLHSPTGDEYSGAVEMDIAPEEQNEFFVSLDRGAPSYRLDAALPKSQAGPSGISKIYPCRPGVHGADCHMYVRTSSSVQNVAAIYAGEHFQALPLTPTIWRLSFPRVYGATEVQIASNVSSVVSPMSTVPIVVLPGPAITDISGCPAGLEGTSCTLNIHTSADVDALKVYYAGQFLSALKTGVSDWQVTLTRKPWARRLSMSAHLGDAWTSWTHHLVAVLPSPTLVNPVISSTLPAAMDVHVFQDYACGAVCPIRITVSSAYWAQVEQIKMVGGGVATKQFGYKKFDLNLMGDHQGEQITLVFNGFAEDGSVTEFGQIVYQPY